MDIEQITSIILLIEQFKRKNREMDNIADGLRILLEKLEKENKKLKEDIEKIRWQLK